MRKILVLLLVLPGLAFSASTQRVSLSTSGAQADRDSWYPAVSGDGGKVAFQSFASNLVPGVGGAMANIFVRDLGVPTTLLASFGGGDGGDNYSFRPSITSDGRYVVFHSRASDLVAGDTNNRVDVFMRDTVGSATTMISVPYDGTTSNGDSWDGVIARGGRYVAFTSTAYNIAPGDTNKKADIFRRDTVAGVSVRVSLNSSSGQIYSDCHSPAISADGRYVAFVTAADGVVPGDYNGLEDVFLRDVDAGTTVRVSLTSGGGAPDAESWSPAVSDDGSCIAFVSAATNIVPGDTNGCPDVFLRDRTAGTTELVSVGLDGAPADGPSYNPTISADGRYVCFHSEATNLVPGDTNGVCDVFVRDRVAGVTVRVSVAGDGSEGNGISWLGAISADGRWIAFQSAASNLVAGDTNSKWDIFIRGPLF